jgi:IstB-like ATP binding protein
VTKLFFALVSRRYERSSNHRHLNRGFEQWGVILGDAMVAAVLIERLVRLATLINFKGKSYRLRERSVDVVPTLREAQLTGIRSVLRLVELCVSRCSLACFRVTADRVC